MIPCYNEAQNLPLLVARIEELFVSSDVEVILVDNGSTDDTQPVLETLLKNHAVIRSIKVEFNRGYGFGILAGLEAAQGEILGWTHADMQTDPCDALKALTFFETSASPEKIFVKGLRHGRPFVDQIFTFGMSFFESILLLSRLRDINAQPTLFHRSFFEAWDGPPQDFSLDLFAYFRARKFAFRIARFDVNFGTRAYGKSHWNIDFRSKIKFIRRTLTYSWKLRVENS